MKRKTVTILSLGMIFSASILSAQKKNDSLKTKEIEEVVMVAFSSQKKEAIVGSVTKVDSKTIQNQQATSVLSSLQGTVSGVNIITSGGQPGTNPTINIRGVGSINASTDPLIIVDGSPYGGNINNIPQDQVESISVLKDASSTALYGSRAANGVLIITTKRGRLNTRPKVSLTTLVGVSTPAVGFHKTLNAEQFMKYSWQAIRNNQLYFERKTEAEANQYATDNLISTLGYNPYNVANPIGLDGNVVNGAQLLWDTNWRKHLIDETAYKQEARLSVSGGSDNTKYFFAADYLSMEGGVKTSDFERLGFRVNIDSKVNKWLDVGLNTSFTNSFQNAPTQAGSSYSSPIQWMYSLANIYPLYQRDENGNIMLDGLGNLIYDYGDNGASGRLVNAQRIFNNENAVGALYNNKRRYNRMDVIANGYAQITLTDYLKLKSQASYQVYLYDAKEYTHYAYGAAASVGGRVSQNRDLAKTTNFTNSLNFNKSFGDHNVEAQAIFEVMDYKYDALSAQGTGFLPNVYALNSSTVPERVGGYITPERLVSYLGRASYNFKNKYFIEGSLRRDGSTRFSPDTRWGTFYSVGGAWVVSKENWFQNNIVNYLKLKGSYGELGNNSTESYFPYLSTYSTGWNQLGQTGILLGSVVDRNLTWEKTAMSNVGVEFGFFNNRISGNVEYFNKASIDLIYAKPLPGSTGNTSITTNIGAIRNYGWEIELSSTNIRKSNFEWKTSLNLSFIKNEITKLTQESFVNGTKRWAVGQSLYDFHLVEWAGVDPNTGMGMWWYDKVDPNTGAVTREKTSDYSLANSEKSRRYVGSSLPDFTGGLNNYFRIGQFDVNALFNFSFGSKILDYSYSSLMSGFASAGYQQSVDVLKAWTKPGDVTDVPMNVMRQNNNNSTSTRFLFDNDYIRLKSLTLGYNVKKELIENFGLNGIRIFLQADNLWTWQSHKGIDPEQSLAGTTNSRSYNLKTISLGFNLNF